MYTMKDWERDGDFKAKVGEVVEDAIYWELLNCVPPLTHTHSLMQVGEPYGADAELPQMLFRTFKRTDQGWVNCGLCLAGQTENRTTFFEKYFHLQ